MARALEKETGGPAKIKHEETMISLRGWLRDRGQIKLRKGIWLLVVLICSLKASFSALYCHLNLSPRYLILSAGCSRPIRQWFSCLRLYPQGPMLSRIKQKNSAFNNLKQAHSSLIPSYTAQSSPAGHWVVASVVWFQLQYLLADSIMPHVTCFLWALHVDWWALEELPH